METRNTIQKQTILQAVKELANHPTAEQVYEKVSVKLPNISRATVYRNLSFMADHGMLRRIGVPGGADHYDHTLKTHYHVLCTECGALEDIWLEQPAADLLEMAGEKSLFSIQSYQLVFQGVCPCCEAKYQHSRH